MKPGCTCLTHKEGLIISNGSEKIKKKRPCIAKRTISSKKMLYAIFFNSSGPVVQVPCPSGHTVTGRFYKNSVLKKVKEFYNKKRQSKGWSGVHLLHDNASSHKCEVVKSFLASENVKVLNLGGSVGCAVRLETRRSRVQPPPRSATFFSGDWSWNIFYGHSLPSADSRRAVVSFWRKNVHNTG